MKLYNYTPSEVKTLAEGDTLSTRNLILGLQVTANALSDLLDEVVKRIHGTVKDTSVLNIAYRPIPFAVPCMNEYDSYSIINHPVQLVIWKAKFYDKYGDLPMELIGSTDKRIRFGIVRHKSSISKYWQDKDNYLLNKANSTNKK